MRITEFSILTKPQIHFLKVLISSKGDGNFRVEKPGK